MKIKKITIIQYMNFIVAILLVSQVVFAQAPEVADEIYRDDFDCEELYLDADSPDNPRIRNAIDIGELDTKYFRLTLHTFTDGVTPLATQTEFNDAVDVLNTIYADTKIQFVNTGFNVYEVDEIMECTSYNNSTCISSNYCSWHNGSCWANQSRVVNYLVDEELLDVEENLSIILADFYSSNGGFPWAYPSNTNRTIRISIIGNALGDARNTLAHELGHKFGLYHIYMRHYVDNPNPPPQYWECNPCWESPGLPSHEDCEVYDEENCETTIDGCYWDDNVEGEEYCGTTADIVGDFISDTPGQLRKGGMCGYLEGDDPCNNEPYETDPNYNLMTQQNCRDELTDQQIQRMHGWIEYDYEYINGQPHNSMGWIMSTVITNENSSFQNISGTLILTNEDTDNIFTINSTDEEIIPIREEDTYSIETTEQMLTYSSTDYYHLQWGSIPSDHLMTKTNFSIIDGETISANFDTRTNVSVLSTNNDVPINIHDPWYIDPTSGNQEDEFHEISSGVYGVFLEQDPAFNKEYYSLLAYETYPIDSDEIYVFSGWEGNAYVEDVIENDPDELETPVVFYSGGQVTAVYDVVEDDPAGASSAPTGLSVSGATGNPVLTWTHVNDGDRSHYNVWVKYTTFGEPGFWHARSTVTTNSWTDTNVGTGGGLPDRAYYKITVEDYFPNVSTYSN